MQWRGEMNYASESRNFVGARFRDRQVEELDRPLRPAAISTHDPGVLRSPS
jgi:hypothetical protein